MTDSERQSILSSNNVYSQSPPPYNYNGESQPTAPPYEVQQPYQAQPRAASVPVYIVQASTLYGEFPVSTICGACNTDIITLTTSQNGNLTWLLAGIICFVGGWILCLCLIPFCINACKDVVHSCPNCHAVIGKYCRPY